MKQKNPIWFLLYHYVYKPGLRFFFIILSVLVLGELIDLAFGTDRVGFLADFLFISNGTSIYTIFSPFQIALLAILITSYIFLLSAIRKEEMNDYAHEMIEKFISSIKNRSILCALVCVVLATTVLIIGGETSGENSCVEILINFGSICIIIEILFLIILILAHKSIIYKIAEETSKKIVKKQQKGGKKSSNEIAPFILEIENLEQMVSQVHSFYKQKITMYFKEEALRHILEMKNLSEGRKNPSKNGDNDANKRIENYFVLLSYRDTYMVMRNREKNSLFLYDENLKKIFNEVEKYFYSNLFFDGQFKDLVIGSSTNISESNFANTKFEKIDFINADLSKADFRSAKLIGCRFDDIKLGEANCTGADFSGSIFVLEENKNELFSANTEANTKANTKLDYTVFDEVQFTSKNLTIGNSQDKNIGYILDFGEEIIRYITFRNTSFVNASITNMKVKFAVLDKANFSYASIESGEFSYSNFINAILINARISSMVFQCSDLSNANMMECQLLNDPDKVMFVQCVLNSVNLFRAVLKDIKFEKSMCNNAIFDNASLENVSLSRTLLKKASFTKTLMNRVDLSYSLLIDANFSDVKITRDDNNKEWNSFEKADCTGARFTQTPSKKDPLISRSHFKNTLFKEAFFMGARIKCCWFEHSTFLSIHAADTIFEDSTFDGVVFKSSRFISTVFKIKNKIDCKFDGSTFKDCEFDNLKFEQITLRNVDFKNCEFLTLNQVFSSVKLKNVTFQDCSFPNPFSIKTLKDFFNGTDMVIPDNLEDARTANDTAKMRIYHDKKWYSFNAG